MPIINWDGKIREQVETENKVRADYARKWAPIENMQSYEHYNPNKYNLKLNNVTAQSDETKRSQSGEGESYFVSKEMYDVLLDKCRCGRKRTGGHLLKCLQSIKFEHEQADGVIDLNEQYIDPPLPRTSAGIIGWPNTKYRQWDRMTRVKTVNENIIGNRVMDHPYSAIHIG